MSFQEDGPMAFRAMRVALLLAGLPIAGCGTMANLAQSHPESGGKSPFGGVRQDLACFEKASNGEIGYRARPKSDAELYPRRALMFLSAIDLPFSFIGDILTWPYAVSYTCINQPSPVPPVIITDPPVTQAMPVPNAPLPMDTPYVVPDTQPMKKPTPPETKAEADGKLPPSP
jgi:uncharacterized protein YceK